MKPRIGLGMVLVLASLGCKTTSSVSEISETPPIPPTGTWALAAFELSDGQVIPVADIGAYTLELVDDERIHVRADCNVCNGDYSLTEGTLRIGLLACTLAACPPGSLEGRYLRALESASTFQVEGDSLRIAYDEGVMRFVRT